MGPCRSSALSFAHRPSLPRPHVASAGHAPPEESLTDAPFFWSQHYDVPIAYTGHAEKWDHVDIEGDIQKRDCLVRYCLNGNVLAVASIYRDIENLKEEAAMERA
jgi:hypothetical protein